MATTAAAAEHDTKAITGLVFFADGRTGGFTPPSFLFCSVPDLYAVAIQVRTAHHLRHLTPILATFQLAQHVMYGLTRPRHVRCGKPKKQVASPQHGQLATGRCREYADPGLIKRPLRLRLRAGISRRTTYYCMGTRPSRRNMLQL